jgi:putative heme-binding domain-containing protein
LRGAVLHSLARIDWAGLSDPQRLELLRVYEVHFNRLGRPDDAACKEVSSRFDAHYPSHNRFINGELCQLLVYLQNPQVAVKTLKMMAQAPTQEEQIDYAKSLRMLKVGWTPELRMQYFKWFPQAAGFRGGPSIEGYLKNIQRDAIAMLTAGEKQTLGPLLDVKWGKEAATAPTKARPLVKKWTVEELTPLVDKGLKNRDFDRGRQLFGEAKCFACHRVSGEGGAQGPDLTAAGGRFNVRDLLESIIEPSKVISDQYADLVITMNSGKIVTGRIINLHGDNITVNTDMFNPTATVNVSAKNVDTMVTSKISPMPTGLVDSLQLDEIQDLVAFLLSRGDRKNEMFRK